MKKLLRILQKPSRESGVVEVAGQPIPYTIERSARRTRTIAFRVTAERTLRIIAPMRTRLSTIYATLTAQSDGMLRSLVEQHQKHAPESTTTFTDGSTLLYLGYPCRLSITQDTTHASSCTVMSHRIMINIPHADLSPQSLRDEVRLEWYLWLKKRARVKFKKRMDVWAQRLNVSYKRMVISSPEQRWGSCSADNTIRLNWRLMLAPLPILDYVVAHELSHCVHKNHAAGFWRFMATAMPDYQARRHQLRRLSSQLHI